MDRRTWHCSADVDRGEPQPGLGKPTEAGSGRATFTLSHVGKPNHLGDYLRARRARVTPAEVGLVPGPRRRLAGLRRDELAMLAGISSEYLQRLEQGRDRHPSAEVLDSIARALRMDAKATAHLHKLAHSASRPHRAPQTEHVSGRGRRTDRPVPGPGGRRESISRRAGRKPDRLCVDTRIRSRTKPFALALLGSPRPRRSFPTGRKRRLWRSGACGRSSRRIPTTPDCSH